jgi:LPXTG-site transpeptidase (sortase) family protein
MDGTGQEWGTRDRPARRRVTWRTVADAGSYLLFGFAVGLIGFFFASDVLTAWDQSMVRRSAPPALTGGVLGPPGPRLDFDGWAEEDALYWKGLAYGGAFGRLVIPRMGLDVVAVKGAETRDLWKGPGWIPQTDMPGPTGNVGISGHRTTFGRPFARLDEMALGDTIDLYSPFRRYRYVVESTEVVTPRQTSVVSSTVEPRLTLTTCHPEYSARFRLVVHARLTAVDRLATQAPEAAAAP